MRNAPATSVPASTINANLRLVVKIAKNYTSLALS